MESVPTYLFTQGVLGVTVLVLGFVCAKLYNSREADRKDHAAEVKELNALRLQDSKDVTADVTEVIQGNATAIRILTEKIETAKK